MAKFNGTMASLRRVLAAVFDGSYFSLVLAFRDSVPFMDADGQAHMRATIESFLQRHPEAVDHRGNPGPFLMDIVFTPHRPRQLQDGILVPPRSNPPSPVIEPTAEEEPITISSEDDPAGRVVEYTVSSSGSNNTIVDENGRITQVNAAPEVNSLDPYFGQLEEVTDPARNARPDHRRVPTDVVADTPRLLAGEHCIVSQKFHPLGAVLPQIIRIFSPTLSRQAIHSQKYFCNTLLTNSISPLINHWLASNSQIRMAYLPTPATAQGEESSESSTGQEEICRFDFESSSSPISSKYLFIKLTIEFFYFPEATGL